MSPTESEADAMDGMLEELEAYYAKLSREGGFEGRCFMALPDGAMAGLFVLDVGCRRGKGCYKLSELVGPEGRVIGLDWNAEAIESARAGEAEALARSGLSRSNMEFRVGFPEALEEAGIAEASVDAVYVNSSLSLFCDPPRALAACARALRPGGALMGEAVVAEEVSPDPTVRAAVVAAARQRGDAVGAAPAGEELASWLAAAGFDGWSFEDAGLVEDVWPLHVAPAEAEACGTETVGSKVAGAARDAGEAVEVACDVAGAARSTAVRKEVPTAPSVVGTTYRRIRLWARKPSDA